MTKRKDFLHNWITYNRKRLSGVLFDRDSINPSATKLPTVSPGCCRAITSNTLFGFTTFSSVITRLWIMLFARVNPIFFLVTDLHNIFITCCYFEKLVRYFRWIMIVWYMCTEGLEKNRQYPVLIEMCSSRPVHNRFRFIWLFFQFLCLNMLSTIRPWTIPDQLSDPASPKTQILSSLADTLIAFSSYL